MITSVNMFALLQLLPFLASGQTRHDRRSVYGQQHDNLARKHDEEADVVEVKLDHLSASGRPLSKRSLRSRDAAAASSSGARLSVSLSVGLSNPHTNIHPTGSKPVSAPVTHTTT